MIAVEVGAGSAGLASANRRGAALPIVLLFAALIAGLAASAMRSSLSGVRAASAFLDAARADELGHGAADALAYHLATHDKASRRGGRIALHLADAEVTIDYRSESARVDANLAPLDLVAALLAAAGAEPGEAAAAAARAGQFRALAARKIAAAKPEAAPAVVPIAVASPGGQSAPVDGSSPGGGTPPPPLALHDTSEVAGAWGLSDAVARRVLPFLTVSNGTPQVDPVLADRVVLAALLGGDERVDDYVERRARGFVTEDSALDLVPVPSRRFVGFRDSEAVRAVARIALPHGFTRRYEMILAPPRPSLDASHPSSGSSVPLVVSWRRLA